MRAILWSALICHLSLTVVTFTNIDESDKLRYVDENLAFSLSLNRQDQRFLQGESLEGINRDAVVGVIDENDKFYSLIIVSKVQNLAVENFAQITLEELPIDEKKIHSFNKNAIQGNPSVSVTFQGRVQEHLIHYQIDFIYFKNFIYQHVNFKISDKDQPDLQNYKPTLELLTNLVPQLSSVDDTNLNFGLTWYLDDDEYAHLGYRFKLPSKISGFRTLWGEKSQFFHPEALIGYEADNGRRSIYVIATNDHDDLDTFVNYWKKSFADSSSLQKVDTKSDDYAILDFNSAEQVLRYQIRFEKGSHGSVALIQFSRPMDNLPFPASLLVGFKWIKGENYSSSLRKLRSPKFGRLMIGDQESFYQNTYNHYGLGVSWTFPVSDLLEAGFQEDGHVEAEYSLYVENFSQKYFGTLQIQEDQFADSLQYHKDNLPQASNVKSSPTKQKLGFYYTPFVVEGQNYNYLHVTKKHKDVYVKSLIWSLDSLNPDQFISQIKFDNSKALEFTSDSIKHSRLGFNLEKSKDFRARLITPLEIEPIGEVIQLFSSLIEHELYVLKSVLMDDDVLLDLYLKNKKPKIQIVPGEIINQKYIGLDVNQRKFTIPLGDRPKILFQRTLRRGDTIFSSFSLVDPTLQDKSLFFEPFKLSFDRKGWIQ